MHCGRGMFKQVLTGCYRCRVQVLVQQPAANFTLSARYLGETQGSVVTKRSRYRWILYTSGAASVSYLYAKNPTDSEKVRNSKVSLYRKMPLKAMSRVWGKMTCWHLPVSMREPLLGLYVRLFGVNLAEANDGDLKNYKNLNEFFRRELKPDARVVDPVSPVTSPADGKILHFGKVEDGVVEQVKGVNYAIQGFLGPQPGKHCDKRTKPLKDTEYHERLDIKPGELLSVNPGVARWVQGLFNFNERVVYSGTWQHGFFSYTAVGATNVGSIKIYFDKDLQTNIGKSYPDHVYYDKSFDTVPGGGSVSVEKGEMLGEFNLGSTIVLMFEAPSDFQFYVQPGQKVKFGEALGNFDPDSNKSI